MNKISLETLGKIAIGGLFLFPITGYSFRWLIQGKIKKSASYTEVMECLRSHSESKELLGEPIAEGRIDIGDNNACGQKDNVKWFTIPVKGPKASGNLTYWITSTENDFEISKIKLILDNPSKTSVLIKNI